MSFCPSNDIHSVYLDNELPKEFLAEYEAHINSCPKCQQELNKLKQVQSFLTADSKNITPDSHYLDESFTRLQIKMSYSKTTKHHQREFDSKNFNYIITSFATAAAVALAFVIPLSFRGAKGSNVNPSQVASIPYVQNGNNVSFDSGRSVVISGNIDGVVLSSVNSQGNSLNNVSYEGNNYPPVHHGHRSTGRYDVIGNVEMLRPEFSGEKTISIKVTFPGMYDGPIPPDLRLPENVITGTGE